MRLGGSKAISRKGSWSVIVAEDDAAAAQAATNYPAFNFANTYGISVAGNTGGWYLPTVAELSMLYRAKDTVNSALEKAGGTKIADAFYWSSSQSAYGSSLAWSVLFDDGALSNDDKDFGDSVCTVRAF